MISENIINSIVNSPEVHRIFGKQKGNIKAWLESEPGKQAIEIIRKEVSKHETTPPEKEDSSKESEYLKELYDYSFVLKKSDRDKIIEVFDKTGSVRYEVTITQSGTSHLSILKTGEPIDKPTEAKTPAKASVDISSSQDHEMGADVKQTFKAQEPVSKISICIPTNRDINANVMVSMLGQWKAGIPEEIKALLPRLEVEKDTLIHHARNLLAHRFLQSGSEWSYWQDSDIIASWGNPAWFRYKTQANHPASFFNQAAISKLISRNQTICSGVYVQRNHTRELVAPSSLKEKLKDKLRKGPVNELLESPWVPFGCVAVHRLVFDDIKKSHPELAPKKEGEPWNFFGADLETTSEDVAFSKRARKAGHQPFFDLSVFCGHIGNSSFNP